MVIPGGAEHSVYGINVPINFVNVFVHPLQQGMVLVKMFYTDEADDLLVAEEPQMPPTPPPEAE